MALTNIFNEPARESIETAVGLSVLGALIYADYCFGRWFWNFTGGPEHGAPLPVGMILGAFAVVVITGGIFLAHDWGERICNALERRGLQLRPRMRENRPADGRNIKWMMTDGD